MGRLSLAAWLGALLVVAGVGIYASFHYWITTRTFVAVDLPVSLKRGHLRTGPFPINLSEGYTIWLATDQKAPYNFKCVKNSVLVTRWTLYKDGLEVVSPFANGVRGDPLWGFYGQHAVYDLDVEVLEDASCLDASHPRLQVFSREGDYTYLATLLFWLCAAGAGTGLSLLVIEWNRRYNKPAITRPPHAQPGTAGGRVAWKTAPLKGLPFSGFSAFGFHAASILVSVVPILVVFHDPPRDSVGWHVRLLRPGISGQGLPGMDPVLVSLRLTRGNPQPELYVNSQVVSWEYFDAALQDEINQRPPGWPVYFEGDGDMDWQVAARAIDRIRGLDAQVILLTRTGARGAITQLR